MRPLNPFTGPEHQAFILRGGEPAALLIHGFPGTPREMRPLAETIHAQGWTCQALLLPGFGPDLDTLPRRRLSEWQRAINDAAYRLKETHQPVAIVGFSMGGALALSTAHQTQPDALILLSPFWRLNHNLWRTFPLFRLVLPRFRPFRLFKADFSNPQFRQGMSEFMPDLDLDDPAAQESMRDFTVPVAMMDELRKAGRHARQVVSHIQVPLLVLQGWQDELVPARQTRRFLRDYAGPIHYLELPAAHDLPDATRPARRHVTAALTRFLTELAPMISPPIWVLIAFFLGAIPFALLLAHLSGKGDVRPVGDGNPGVTNTWKLGSWRLGATVLALDFSKGALPVAAASIFVARSVIQSNIISLVAEILFGVVLVL